MALKFKKSVNISAINIRFKVGSGINHPMKLLPEQTETACSKGDLTVTELARLSAENSVLRDENEALKRRVAWFEKQLFGEKSEKRPVDNLHQPSLLGEAQYQRGKAPKQRPDDCVNDSGLRFNDQVPIKVISLSTPELEGPDADQFEVIGTKSTFRLA